ncbi:MAG: hypothetical protein P4L33_15805 [Capsulimonadaceae bacterium]|nr:hypothetical protein [Capsulimonadaceae bacterium]
MPRRKRRFHPAASIAIGVVVFVVVVVLAWAGATFIPLLLNGATGTPPPPSHLSASTLSDGPSSSDGGTLSYAVSDLETGSDKDRQAMDGKTVTVTGYIVVSTNDSQIIVDDATAKNAPRLKVAPPSLGLRIGDKVSFTGVYSASAHSLKVTSAKLLK